MSKCGVTDLMLTPHYVEESDFVCNNKEKKSIYNKLVNKAKEEEIDINLYLGNEVFFTENMLDLIKKDEIMTLNNSKYILFEFPLNSLYKNFRTIISELISKGYTPILAHPERYIMFHKHPELAADYVRMGVLLQGNTPSLFGKYGRISEKTLKFFLKKGWITVMGSDTHHSYENISEKKLRRKLYRITKDDDYVERILNTNFDKIINDDVMEIKRFN